MAPLADHPPPPTAAAAAGLALRAVARGDKKGRKRPLNAALGLRKPGAAGVRGSHFLTNKTTGFSVLLRGAYVADNGKFALMLFLAAAFSALVTLLSQSARRAEASVLARRPRPRLKVRAAAALVHGVRMLMLYVAVLVATTHNLWLLFAMVTGHILGWLVFAGVAPIPPLAAARQRAVVDGVFDDDDDRDNDRKAAKLDDEA